MKISSLNYFVAIAETGSVNQAAKKLYIAQPSLTKSIKLMENELGVILFEWTEEPGGLQSMGSQRVGYDLANEQQQQLVHLLFVHLHFTKK